MFQDVRQLQALREKWWARVCASWPTSRSFVNSEYKLTSVNRVQAAIHPACGQ